jgi:hypothetical protein
MAIELAVATLHPRRDPRHHRRLGRRQGDRWRWGCQDRGLRQSTTHTPSSKTGLLGLQLRHRL